MKKENKTKHHVQVNLDKELDEALLKLAAEEDRSLSGMCIRLIKEAIKARRQEG